MDKRRKTKKPLSDLTRKTVGFTQRLNTEEDHVELIEFGNINMGTLKKNEADELKILIKSLTQQIENNFDKIDKRFDRLEDKVEKLENNVENEFQDLKSDLKKDFEVINNKMLDNSSKVGEIKGTVDTMKWVIPLVIGVAGVLVALMTYIRTAPQTVFVEAQQASQKQQPK